VICLICTALVAVTYVKEWFLEDAERNTRDWLMTNSTARRSAADPRLVLLGIDEASRSLDTLFADDLEKSSTLRLMKKGWPWNRQVHADIINRLADAGASAIIFDVIFPSEREGDDAFRAALIKHADKVVIGSNLVDKRHILPSRDLLPPADVPSWIGFVTIKPDPDGLQRHVYYRTTADVYFGTPRLSERDSKEIFSLGARGLEKAGLVDRIPPGHQPVMCRASQEIAPLSLVDLFIDTQWNAPPYNGGKFFRDKIVVIGDTQQASEDRVLTPYGNTLGVAVHVNAINAALKGDFIREFSTKANVGLIIAGGFVAWMLGAWVSRPVLRLFALVVAMLGYYELALNLANNYDLLPSLLSPLLALGSSAIVWAAWEQVLDRQERQRVRRHFERYVSKDVVREILDNPQTYLDTLGGQRKEVAVLFSDIRGFTTLTESADPHALVQQLNEYFGEMVRLVFANQGTQDKFIGDAVMAHWGSITTAGPKTDAIRAVTTALQMRESLARLNANWKERGMHEWKFGIGINCGRPIVGNIGAAGTAEKYDFTVIGDAVNLASRLEGVTKKYGIDICIGERVAAHVADLFILRSVDLIIVKGKTKPVEIFTVLDTRKGAEEPPWLAKHEEAMRLYRAAEFPAAEKIWRDIVTEIPKDGLAKIYIWRCIALQANPPEPPWTGVFEMKSK
jgi:adenylate cyclase